MGKVVKTVLTGVAIVASIGTGIGAVLGGTMMFTAFGASIAASTIAMAASAGAALVGALQGRPKIPQSETHLDRLTARLDTQAPRKLVLGTTAMPADIRYYEGSGKDEEYIDYILAAAAHRVRSIDEIWFEDSLAWSATGGVQGEYVGYLTAVTARTEGTASNTIAINGGTRWGADDRLTGCAYIRLRIKRTGKTDKEQSPLVSGMPGRVTVIGEGMPMYDPRFDSTVGGDGPMRIDDQSTWGESSENPIIQSLNVLLGWRINGKLSVGGGLPPKYINLDSAITAANICDEDIALSSGGSQKRYRGAGAFSTNDAPMDIVAALLAGCAGDLLDCDGQLSFLIKTNTLATPAVTFDDHDVVSGASWDPMGGQTNIPNIVAGSFTDPSSLYQMPPFPSVSLPSEDGIDRVARIDFATVENAARAERLAKQTLQRMQYSGTFTAEYNMKGMAATIGSIVWQTYSPLGWINKPFRVVSQKPSRSGRIALVLREENAAIYAWEAEDSASVQPAEPVRFDPLNSGPILLARQAGKTAEWPSVSDPDGTKPEDGATKGAPPGTPVGTKYAEEVLADIDQTKSDIDDLFETYGSTASAAASASAAEQFKLAAELAKSNVEDIASDVETSETAAKDAASEAKTYRDQASKAAGDAGESAATATQQANLSTQAANDSGDSANASAGSAAVATSKAGEAGQSAASAQADRIAAQAANDNVESIAENVRADKTSADASAASASASQSLSAEFAATAQGVANSLYPKTLDPVGRQAYNYEGQVITSGDASWPQPYITQVEAGQITGEARTRVKVPLTKQVGRRYRVTAWVFSYATNMVFWLGLYDGPTPSTTDRYLGAMSAFQTPGQAWLKISGEFEVMGYHQPNLWPDLIFTGKNASGSPDNSALPNDGRFHTTALIIEDITESSAAQTQANISAQQAAIATDKASQASTAQTLTVQYRDQAAGSAGSALTAANTSTSQAAIATAQASAAQRSVALAASASSGDVNQNSKFVIWTGDGSAPPDGWAWWSQEGATISRQLASAAQNWGGYCAQIVAPAGTDCGLVQGNGFYLSNPVPIRQGWYVFHAETYLNAGSYNCTGLTVQGVFNFHFGSEADTEGDVSPTKGGLRQWSKLVYVSRDDLVNWHIMMNWSGWGTPTAKTISWFDAGLRRASSAEIKTGKIDNLEAQVAINQGVLAEHSGKLSAYWELQANAGTNSAVIAAKADGSSSTIAMAAAKVVIANPDNNNDLRDAVVFEGGEATMAAARIRKVTSGLLQNLSGSHKIDLDVGRIIFDNGSVMKVTGNGFGTSSQFLEWFGPSRAIDQCDEASAIQYVKTNGAAYFGGALSAGTIKNAVQTTSIAQDASISTGVVGSRGGTRQVVVSYNWSFVSTYNTNIGGANSGSGLAVQVNVKRNGVVIGTLNASGTWSITPYEGAGGGSGKYSANIGGSLTISDTSGGATVEYSAEIVSRTIGAGQPSATAQSVSTQQQLSIVQTEQ